MLFIEPKIFEERLPCQDKPWDRKWADYDFSILKEKVTHALKLINLGMKKFIAATKNVQITSKQKAEKEKKYIQLKQIDAIMSKIDNLPKSAKKCMLKEINDIMAAHKQGNINNKDKMLPNLEKMEKYLQSMEKGIPCKYNTLDKESNGFDYEILKEKVYHALILMHIGNKNYLAKQFENLTSQQKDENDKQYERIEDVFKRIDALVGKNKFQQMSNSAKFCMIKGIGDMMGLPEQEHDYDLDKMLKTMEQYLQ